MIIGIFGQKRHGKNTVAKYLRHCIAEYANQSGMWGSRFPHTYEWAFATRLKEAVALILGIDVSEIDKLKESDPKIRKMLQDVGTVGREYDPQHWINRTLGDINQQIFAVPRVIYFITDGRYFNEAEAIKKNGGINIVVCRPNMINNDPHPSEQDMRMLYKALVPAKTPVGTCELFPDMVQGPSKMMDFYIINNGTEAQLEEQVSELFDSIKDRIFPIGKAIEDSTPNLDGTHTAKVRIDNGY